MKRNSKFVVRKTGGRKLSECKLLLKSRKQVKFRLYQENSEENMILTILNKTTNKDKDKDINDSIELFDIKNNVIPKNKVNTTISSTTKRRSSLNIGDGLLNINVDKLINSYYTGEFKDLTMNKAEILYSDFKTSLKLIEDYKINCAHSNEFLPDQKKALTEPKESQSISPTRTNKSMNEANVNLIEI
jgi:hypothetical protein